MKNTAFILCVMLLTACESYSKYPISNAGAEVYDARLIGKWKLEEDTDKNNYYVVEHDYDIRTNKYHAQFYNRGGKNPSYEASIYFSKVGKDLFLNLPYWVRHEDMYDDKMDDYKQTHGYFFVRILNANTDYTKITTATVQDDALANINSSEEVFARIEKNLNNPSYYHDTIHFYKVQ